MVTYNTWKSLVDDREYNNSAPDESELLAHYDFSVEDGTMPVTDQSGNGHDLTNGDGYSMGTLNGVDAGYFNIDVKDFVYSDTFTSPVSAPLTIVMAAKLESDAPDNTRIIVKGSTDDTLRVGYEKDAFDDSPDARDGPGGGLTGGTISDTLITNIRKGSSGSTLRTMGTEVASGVSQTADMDVVSLGSKIPHQTQDYFDGVIGEVLIYPSDKSSNINEIETYMADKWGITI